MRFRGFDFGGWFAHLSLLFECYACFSHDPRQKPCDSFELILSSQTVEAHQRSRGTAPKGCPLSPIAKDELSRGTYQSSFALLFSIYHPKEIDSVDNRIWPAGPAHPLPLKMAEL